MSQFFVVVVGSQSECSYAQYVRKYVTNDSSCGGETLAYRSFWLCIRASWDLCQIFSSSLWRKYCYYYVLHLACTEGNGRKFWHWNNGNWLTELWFFVKLFARNDYPKKNPKVSKLVFWRVIHLLLQVFRWKIFCICIPINFPWALAVFSRSFS